MPLSVGLFSDAFPPAVDGVATTVENYARWMAANGHKCTLVVPETPGMEYHTPYRLLTFSSLPLNQRPPYRMGLPGIDLRLHEQLRKVKLDLVHAHSPFGAGIEALNYARIHRRATVATFHSKYYDDFLQATRSPFLARQLLQTVMRVYEKADYVWTVNHSTAETMREYGFRGPIEIMPNGTDMAMPPEAEIASMRAKVNEKYRFSDTESVLIFVGQHVWQKNIRMLLEAAADLRKKPNPFKLLMVGTGYALDDIKALAHSLNLDDVVVFAGPVYERELLSAIYIRADMLIFPSFYDNAPLVLREAASMECPAVLISGTNAAKDTEDGVNAFLCGHSAAQLSERIAAVLEAPEKIADVGAKARMTLARPWDDIMPKVLRRYEEIVDEHVFRQKKTYVLTKRRVHKARRRTRK